MKIFPNNKTKFFLSISTKPGNTGSKFHNTLYRYFDMNCLYFPLKVKNVSSIKKILIDFNIAGCSVSMPFKKLVINKVNKLDKSAFLTKNINTILNKKNKLIGYNTDYFAALKIFSKKIKKKNGIVILGDGAVARTLYIALKKLKFKNIFLCSRKKRYQDWNLKNNDKIINWNERNNLKTNTLVNATPIGMSHLNYLPIKKPSLKNFNNIVDLTINSNNKLKKVSNKLKIKYIDGYEFALNQALKQFKIYTQKKIDTKTVKKDLKVN